MEIILEACMDFIQRIFQRHRILKAFIMALIFMVGTGLVYIEWSVVK